MEENSINLGEWNVPSSWNEITLKKFEEVQRYYAEKDDKFDVRDVIHILCDKTIDEVNALPIDFLDIILGKLSFMQENPREKEPSNKVVIDGVTYQVNIQQKLKFGEYVSADGILKNDKYDYASLLAILCRKEGEVYDSKFEAEVFPSRVEMFEKQSVVDILPIIGFFLQCYITSQIPTQLFSEVEEAINHIAQSLDSSDKIGGFRKFYLKWRVKTLRKSLKSIKSI